MTRLNRSLVGAVFAISALVIVLVGVSVRAQEGRTIHVSSTAELYAAVNDPGNAGARIVLAPGTYFLDPAQANGGRLEFQQDMSIVGQRGDADAVVIDASNLPPASYSVGAFRTAPLRMGRGSNALEWVTVQNAHSPAVAGVETDLLGLGAAVVRVAHVVAQGNPKGIDIRNLGPAFNGHLLRVILQHNVFRDNADAGIRVVNVQGVSDATIRLTLRDNHAYGNSIGCAAFNSETSHNTILIDSRWDRFTNNAVGLVLVGGLTTTAGTQANSNVLVFQAHADTIEQNDVPIDPAFLCRNWVVGTCYPSGGGINVIGGSASRTVPYQASANLVHLAVVDTSFSGNQDADINGWGAFSPNELLSGTDNHVTILLKGVSRDAALATVDSDPADPDGTNTVVVRRRRGH